MTPTEMRDTIVFPLRCLGGRTFVVCSAIILLYCPLSWLAASGDATVVAA
jgi:hypothetical protein